MPSRLLQSGLSRLRPVLAAIALALPLAFTPVPGLGTTYHVSTTGQDDNSGLSEDQPLRSIQTAANLARAGDTILVQQGTYREYVTFPNSGAPEQPITLSGHPDQPPPVLSGSEVVTDWVHYTNHIWMLPHWPIPSQQVFDNGRPLSQLGWPNRYFQDAPGRYNSNGSKGLPDMTPNTFYYDPTNLVLYVWLDNNLAPTNRTMEVATRLGTINARNMWGGTNASYHVRRFTFRHSNTCTHSSFGWPGVWLPRLSTLADATVEWNDAAGISLGTNSVITNVVVSSNGQIGGSAEFNFLFSHCTIVSNNYRNFSPVWHASGLKFIPDSHGILEQCEVAYNNGPGIWFDTCLTGQPSVIRHNYVHHNSQNALFIELTQNVDIHNNLLLSNVLRSIYVSSSEDVRIFNNTIAGHRQWMTVEFHYSRLRTNANGVIFPLRNNRFYNNIVYNGASIRDLLMVEDDPPHCQNNLSDYNCYFRDSGGQFMAMNRINNNALAFSSLAEWTRVTGQDPHSLAADPLFVDPAQLNFHLQSQAGALSNSVWSPFPSSSPCIDTGDPKSAFQLEPPWNGGRANIGLYGNTPEASLSQDEDQDGASDSLELNSLGTDPSLPDSDGDQVNDYAEYISGTDPLNGEDLLLLRAFSSPDNSEFELAWFGAPERRYAVLSSSQPGQPWISSTQLFDASGQPVSSITGSNAWIQLRDPSLPSTSSRHYRLQVHWP